MPTKNKLLTVIAGMMLIEHIKLKRGLQNAQMPKIIKFTRLIKDKNLHTVHDIEAVCSSTTESIYCMHFVIIHNVLNL